LTIGFYRRYALQPEGLSENPLWLMVFYFVVMFATWLLTGPGKFSGDYLLQTRNQSALSE
jgi:hypothetical protein